MIAIISHIIMAISIAIIGDAPMRTVQITLEEELVQAVDQAAGRLALTRSAFARDALRAALAKLESQAREQQHREGYLRQPVTPGEFDDWEDEQVWGD